MNNPDIVGTSTSHFSAIQKCYFYVKKKRKKVERRQISSILNFLIKFICVPRWSQHRRVERREEETNWNRRRGAARKAYRQVETRIKSHY